MDAVFVLVFHVCRGLEAYVMYEDRKGDTHRRTQIGAPSYHHSQRSVPLRISTVKAEVNGDEVRRNEKKEEEEIVDYHEDSEEDKAMYAYTHVFYYPIL